MKTLSNYTNHIADTPLDQAAEDELKGVPEHLRLSISALELLDSFKKSNTRIALVGDEYGGIAVNRARFIVETLEAMVARVGAGRVSLKITPGTAFNDMHDPDPAATYSTLLQQIAHLPLAFIDVSPDDANRTATEVHQLLRPLWPGVYFAGRGLDQHSATALLAAGFADGALFGSSFIANPDLPERFRRNAALAAPDVNTFYMGGAKGYTDYPALQEALSA